MYIVTFFLDIMYNDSFGLGSHFCWVVVVVLNLKKEGVIKQQKAVQSKCFFKMMTLTIITNIFFLTGS